MPADRRVRGLTLLLLAGLATFATVTCRGDRGGGGGDTPPEIDFSVRGGIAGFHLDLHVSPAGEAVLLEHDAEVARRTLPAEQFQALTRMIRAATPSDDRATYGASGDRIQDGWRRVVEVRVDGRSWSIEEHTGATLPAEAGALFEQLMEIAMSMRVEALRPGGEE